MIYKFPLRVSPKLNSLIIFSIIFSCSILDVSAQSETFNYSNKNQANWETVELQKLKKLKIRSRELYSGYYQQNGNLPAQPVLSEISYLDKNGNLIKQEDITSYGQVRSSVELKYNKQQRLIDIVNKKSDGFMTYKKEIFYNGKDTTKIYVTDRKKNKTKQTFLYNAQKQLQQKKYFDEKGQLYLQETYNYENGLLTKIIYTNEKNETVTSNELKYYSNGNLESENINGAVKKYYFDLAGNLIKTEEGSEVRLYKYDDNKNLIDYQYYTSPNRRQFRLGFTYQQDGLVKEIVRYESDDTKAFYSTYKYKN